MAEDCAGDFENPELRVWRLMGRIPLAEGQRMSKRETAVYCAVRASLALLMTSCERRTEPTQRRGGVAAATRETKIPASRVTFVLVPPNGEKWSALFALPLLLDELLGYPQLFKLAADGRTRPPVEGGHMALVGKLPGTVTELDYFVAQPGSVRGDNIEIPARYIRYGGPIGDLPAPRDVYVGVRMPPIKAGRYRARIAFDEFRYMDLRDKSRTERSPPKRPARFAPLVCDLEILPKDAVLGAAGAIALGEPANGLRAGIAVVDVADDPTPRVTVRLLLRNVGEKPVRILKLSAAKCFWPGFPVEVEVNGKIRKYKGPVLEPPLPPSITDFIHLAPGMTDSTQTSLLLTDWMLEGASSVDVTFVYREGSGESLASPFDRQAKSWRKVSGLWTGEVRSGAVKIEVTVDG